jgi:DNA-binding NarL/FixJ family response regulator
MPRQQQRDLTWWGVTPRQRQIVELVCDGLTSVQIAKRLGISARTVEAHRFNLMRRLHVRNVAELLQAAIADGLRSPRHAYGLNDHIARSRNTPGELMVPIYRR